MKYTGLAYPTFGHFTKAPALYRKNGNIVQFPTIFQVNKPRNKSQKNIPKFSRFSGGILATK